MENKEEINNDDSIILSIEGEQLVCSKSVLIDNSDYFKSMLEGGFKEKNQKCIEIKGIDAKSVKDLLQLLSNKSHICGDVYAVLSASSMLLFEDLKKWIICELERNLTPTNSLEIWSVMEKLNIIDLHLKAKSMSLLMFHSIKENGTITVLSLLEVCNYLGHINLQCDKELSVFQSAMHWFRELCKDQNLEEAVTTLKMLIKCISFESASLDEITAMRSDKEIEKYPEILKILNYIFALKCGKEIQASEDDKSYSMAKSLVRSKCRYLPKAPCLLVRKNNDSVSDSQFDIHLYGVTLSKNLGQMRFLDGSLLGYAIHGYMSRVYVIGGEYNYGKGSWNRDVRSFDVVSGIIGNNQLIPSPRRHFESCVCGDYCYIIGGTGTFRVIQDNMFWYNFKTDTWSDQINLPCSGRQLKCCSMDNKLLILSFIDKCGYLYENNDGDYVTLAVDDPQKLISEAFTSTSVSLFAYNGKIFLMGDKLIEMEIINWTIKVVKFSSLSDFDSEYRIETVACHNIIYTLYTHAGAKFSLQYLDLDTMQVNFIFKLEYPDDIDFFDEVAYISKTFSLYHYELVAPNILVNEVPVIVDT